MSVLNSSHWFSTGKWVLCGEHSVLRNGKAIALPRNELGLNLHFESDLRISKLQVQPLTASELVLETISTLDRELKIMKPGWKTPDARGILKLESNIPLGGGLGSSAALCVALTRWYGESAQLSEMELITIATKLENQFHGKSSGMDVTVIALSEPIIYKKGPEYERLSIQRLPPFQFFDTGLRSKTLECIDTVEQFSLKDPERAKQTDLQMIQSTENLIRYLNDYNQSGSVKILQLIADEMNAAQSCFYSWGLVPDRVKEIENQLKQKGAIGVKTTGAGNGGYLVALFPHTALDKNPIEELIF